MVLKLVGKLEFVAVVVESVALAEPTRKSSPIYSALQENLSSEFPTRSDTN